MAFIGNCLNNHDYDVYRKYFLGYIFLYTVIVWTYGLPTPRVNSFEFIQQQVLLRITIYKKRQCFNYQSEESSYESEPEIENETIFVNNFFDNQ